MSAYLLHLLCLFGIYATAAMSLNLIGGGVACFHSLTPLTSLWVPMLTPLHPCMAWAFCLLCCSVLPLPLF
jgi:hypothetical protein